MAPELDAQTYYRHCFGMHEQDSQKCVYPFKLLEFNRMHVCRWKGIVMDAAKIASASPDELTRLLARPGNTPMESIYIMFGGVPRKIYLKMESKNPTGSVKDRTAYGLIQSLETRMQTPFITMNGYKNMDSIYPQNIWNRSEISYHDSQSQQTQLF
jgi:hypothetical protein